MRADLRTPRHFVLVLGALTAVGPLSVDLYLPAFPAITGSLDTSEAMVQVTLVACVVGLGVGQLVAGPLSDRVGRRRPLVAGMVGYVATSAACALAPNVEVLVAARLGQGLAASLVVVVTRATLVDVYESARLARMLSRLMLVVGVVPMFAPVLGGQLAAFGWRGLFWLLAAIGAVLTLVAVRGVPETRSSELRRSRAVTYRALLRDRPFLRYLAAASLAYLAVLAYVAGAPFAYAGHGVRPDAFGLLFGLNALGLTLCAQLNGRLVLRIPPRRLLAAGAAIATAGGLAAMAFDLTGAFGLVGLAGALFVLVASHGLILPNSVALAMDRHPANAGAASALLGCVQFLVSAPAMPLSGLLGPSSSVPMVLTVVAATGAIWLLASPLLGRGKHRVVGGGVEADDEAVDRVA